MKHFKDRLYGQKTSEPARKQMMEKNNKIGRRLRLVPLILGGYGAYLGFGLIVIGIAEIKGVIGIIRLLMGIGIAGFGLLGIWDGVRDLVKPDKRPVQEAARQFILTDSSGNKSSLITPEILRAQMDILTKSEESKSFSLQILPPLPVKEYGGMLNQIACIYHFHIILAAFFEMPKDGYRIYQKSTEPDMGVEWLKQLLAGSPDFFGWESAEAKVWKDEGAARQSGDDIWQNEEHICSDETDAPREGVEAFWHQLLVIFGESWHDEHSFFSARDVELAIEGIHEGKYLKAVLELGTQAVDLFPSAQNDLLVIWRTDSTEKGDTRFLAKTGTVTQAKFWLTGYLNYGFFKELDGWTDITGRIEKEKGLFIAHNGMSPHKF